jgi:hemerythrin
MVIEWTPDLAVGIPDIDRQHQEMFRTLDELVQAMREARGRVEVQRTLNFLRNYVVDHFALEQAWMETTRYRDLREHLSEHQAFLAEVGKLSQQLDDRGTSSGLVIDTCTALNSYLRQHIAVTDRALAAHLKAASAAR